jgi:hypothetical protein
MPGSIPRRSTAEGGDEMHDNMVLRKRIVVLLIAAFLSVAGAIVTTEVAADETQAVRVTDNDTNDMEPS